MRCAGHILNLIVKDELDMISNAIERVRDSVVYWIAFATRVEIFEEATHQLHILVLKNCA